MLIGSDGPNAMIESSTPNEYAHNKITWSQIFELLDKRRVSEIYTHPPKSHDELVNDLRYLQKLIPDKYLNSEFGIEEIRRAVKDLIKPTELTGFLTLPWLHGVPRLLRSLESIYGFDTFGKCFKSDQSMLNQLFATCYINECVPLLSIEQQVGNQNADVVFCLVESTILGHIKTIDQRYKGRRVIESVGHIYSALNKHPGKIDTEQFLGIQLFDGIVTDDVDYTYWENFIFSIPYGPGAYKVQFSDGYSASLTLDWTREGTIKGPDILRNYPSHLAKVEKTIPSDSQFKNVFIGALGSGTLASDILPISSDSFENRIISAEFFIHVGRDGSSFILERTDIFCKKDEQELAVKLNNVLPKIVRLPFY